MQGKVSPKASAEAQVYVGIDVCKAWLDVHIHPIGQTLRVANDRSGLTKLKHELRRHDVLLVVLEATGKLHRPAHRNLDAAGFAVAVINPLRSRLFAEVKGKLAKTDALDAQLLAIMGENLKLETVAPLPQNIIDLQELFQARQATVGDIVRLKNQLGEANIAMVTAILKRRIKAAENARDRLDDEIMQRIKADQTLARRFEIVRSIKGIGPVAAMSLIIALNELGSCSSKQAAMLAGLAPLACDSGDKSGKRRIRGGRQEVRRGIYMAAITASRTNPDLKIFFNRLRDTGKSFKVALTAIMRKLVTLANSLLRDDRLWMPKHA